MSISILVFLIKTYLTLIKRQIRNVMAENIETFTDFLDDAIQNSQPISLPSSCNTELESHNTADVDNNLINNRPSKFSGQCGGLRSIEEIEQKYRSVFNYQYFNLVQSKVIDDALYSDKSIVVCAPTGSGKTVIFEMAIVQLLMEMDDNSTYQDFKIIYMAPIKALCTERLTEWYPKFTKLNHLCIEVTGDTDVEFSQLKPYRIIITTPEKWDMLTRRWRDNKAMVELIKLFLIDEVHILNDPARGPVLEAVVSRMKTVQTSMQSAHRIEQLQRQRENGGQSNEMDSRAPKIRFVAVSATVSNPEDVAEWLSTSNKPAVYYKFGDECRPVKLKRVVEGYPCPEGTSIFKFDIILNYKLWPIIQKYHNGKPTLIFCNTRKSVLLTAEALSREITINFSPDQRAKLVAAGSTIKNKKVQSLVTCGVGCHHAGLLFEERTNIEQAFRNGDLPILITTTTLAMGVNLPAHLVIIKNTQQYVNGAYQEYSISTVLQMVGRAGRPQFDSEATAVIMTRLADKGRYQALVGGCEPLQSYLHKRLAENLNSEAALGTVNDVAQCVQWLRSTFLYVRASRDPKKYLGVPQTAASHLISKKIEELCVKAMNGLASSGLITMDEASCIESTEAGRLMSIHYLDLETMKHIRKIKGDETLEQLLWIVCESHELSDMHLRMDERRCLNALNRNNSAATVRFPMKGKITNRQMKLNCVIQAVLGCLPILEPSLNQEALKVMRIADRICKCIVAYVTRPSQIIGEPKTYQTILSSIVLGKCIKSHLWENSVYVSKQLKGIGPAFSTLLAAAGKINFMLLEESHPRDLERVMNKGPPAGNILRKQISLLPKYQLTVIPGDQNSIKIQLTLLNQMYLAENVENLTAGVNHKCYIIIGDTENCLLLLTSFMDKDLIGIYDGQITLDIRRKHNFEHKVTAHCISSNFVGIDVQCEYLFRDLDGSYKKNPKPISPKDMKPKGKIVRQAAITDTFKIRKRKNNDANETTLEKRKCEYTAIEKLEPANKLYGDNSLKSGTDFYKNIHKHQSHTVNREDIKINENTQCQYIKNCELEGDDDSEKENYDDVTVDSILNEIEKEINDQHKLHIDKPNSGKTKPSKTQHKKIINRLNEFSSRYRKSEKSNYTFIDGIEKESNIIEQCNTNDSKNTFVDSVKTNIEIFLEKTKQRSNIVDNNLISLIEINKPASVNKTINEQIGNNSEITTENENCVPIMVTKNYDDKQISKIDSNLINFIDMKEPGSVDTTIHNKIRNKTAENEYYPSVTTTTNHDNTQIFHIDSDLMNAEIKDPGGINSTEQNKKVAVENEKYATLKATGNKNIEPKTIDSLNEEQNKTMDFDTSLEDDALNTNKILVYQNALFDKFNDILNNDKSINKDDKNDVTIQSIDIIPRDNQNYAFEEALLLNEPSSDKIINNHNSEKLSDCTDVETESNNSIKNIEQSYISKDMDPIYKSYASLNHLCKNSSLRGNHIKCNINEITYTMNMPLTEILTKTECKEEILPTRKRNITKILSASDINANKYKDQIDSNCLTVTEIHKNNNNKIQCTFDDIKISRSAVQHTSPPDSNYLAIIPKDNFPSKNTKTIENTSNAIQNSFSNKIQCKSPLDPRFLTTKCNIPKINTNISAEINCTKTISFTKTQVNVYTKNTMEQKYCITSQFKFDLDIAASPKVNDKSASLIHKQTEFEENIKYNKIDSIISKYEDSNKSSNDFQPSVDIINNNSNIDKEQEIINSERRNSIEVKDEKEDSREHKNRTLDEIIDKYKSIMSSKQKVITPRDYKIQSKTASRQCEKVNRPFKITDLPSLHEPNIEFQNGQYGTQAPIYFSPETRKGIKDNTEVTKNPYKLDQVNLNQDNNNMEIDVDCIQPQIDEVELNDTIDMSQSMFNPKTVLECFKEDIIPPPSEFRDESVSGDQNKTYDIEASPSNINHIRPKGYIFDNLHSSVVESKNLTAELSTETWTLSTNEDGYRDPCNSFNIIRNKSSTSFKPQMSRKAKLNEFKFSPKNTFKNRRK